MKTSELFESLQTCYKDMREKDCKGSEMSKSRE